MVSEIGVGLAERLLLNRLIEADGRNRTAGEVDTRSEAARQHQRDDPWQDDDPREEEEPETLGDQVVHEVNPARRRLRTAAGRLAFRRARDSAPPAGRSRRAG